MKKVVIEPGCISCGSCEFICPQVFHVEQTSQVNAAVDLNMHTDLVKKAALKCPVQVIKYEE